MRELYEADFYKPGIYGSGRVWANAWDVFPRGAWREGTPGTYKGIRKVEGLSLVPPIAVLGVSTAHSLLRVEICARAYKPAISMGSGLSCDVWRKSAEGVGLGPCGKR